MKQEFIPYEQALALKELGFDELTFCSWLDGKLISIHSKEDFFQNSILAPLWQQAFSFFREKYKLLSSIQYSRLPNRFWFKIEDAVFNNVEFKTYEEAQLACLDKIIEIIEQQNK